LRTEHLGQPEVLACADAATVGALAQIIAVLNV
jgi:hypothetical protein